jgi:hypothetical protein
MKYVRVSYSLHKKTKGEINMLFKSGRKTACTTFRVWGIPVTVGVFGA